METKNIPLSERISRGVQYLTRTLNPDGGIPAVKPGDPSGCWTTAESIHAMLSSPWIDEQLHDYARKMVGFVSGSQLSKSICGVWPLVVGGHQGSTMATAQAILALELAKPLLAAHAIEDSTKAIALGVEWLRSTQGTDGGWGVEPNGGPSGKTSRVVASFLALRALSMHGDSVRTSQCIRRGIDWLWSMYDGSGLGPAPGHPAAVCSTVRALWAIQACGASNERPQLLRRAIEFISANRPPSELWPVDTEVYIPDSAPGQIVFNNNTTAELLDFFVQIDQEEGNQLSLVQWFENHQRDDGSWYLGANENLQTDVVTWPTNEAILALSNFLRSARFQSPERRGGRLRSVLLWMFASLSLVEALFLFGAPSYFTKSWSSLPSEYRRTFWWAAVIAVLMNLIATAVVYLSRRLIRSVQDGLRRRRIS